MSAGQLAIAPIDPAHLGDYVVAPALIPRSALTHVDAPPELVSQKNCDHVGLTPPLYLADLRGFARDGGTVLRRGKLRLVDRAAFVTWLRATSARKEPTIVVGSAETGDGVSLNDLGLAPSRRRRTP